MASLLDNLELFPLAAAVLLPGFIWTEVERKLVVQNRTDAMRRVFLFFFYSLLTYCVVGFYFWTDIEKIAQSKQISRSIAISLATGLLGVGVLGGIATAAFRRLDPVCGLLRWLGLPAMNAVKSPWDAAFGRRDHALVRVRTVDDRDVFGLLALNSQAACDEDGRDLFLEKLYIENESRDLVAAVGTKGVWIPGDRIHEVRFYTFEELDSDSGKAQCKASERPKHSNQDTEGERIARAGSEPQPSLPHADIEPKADGTAHCQSSESRAQPEVSLPPHVQSSTR
mgnify:CR=1 FL=1